MMIDESTMAGYRVLDLTDEKGYLCAKLLGDLGADVIKIEKPGGDSYRRIGPFYKDRPDPNSSLHWFAFNANKRGITLNLESVDGREILQDLVKTSDFIIESFSPGYLETLALSYDDLSRVNPRIIMTSITPFGQTGPKAHYKVCDLVSWASAGTMYCCGDPDRPPLRLSVPQSFLHAGSEAAVASLIAHYYREITGEGQWVDVSIQESVIGALMDTQEMWDLRNFDFKRSGHAWTFVRSDGAPVRQSYCLPCKDGWVACYTLGGKMLSSVNHLKSLVKWMDEEGAAPEWLKDFDWVNEYETAKLTQEEIEKVEGALVQFLRTKTKEELYDQAIQRRLILAPVCTPEDIVRSDQLETRGFWMEIRHPELDTDITYCGEWAKLSETPLRIRRRAPLIGEHNEEIYAGELGFSKLAMTSLMAAGII